MENDIEKLQKILRFKKREDLATLFTGAYSYLNESSTFGNYWNSTLITNQDIRNVVFDSPELVDFILSLTDEYYNQKDTAKILGVDVKTIRNMTLDGRLIKSQGRGHKCYSRGEIINTYKKHVQ